MLIEMPLSLIAYIVYITLQINPLVLWGLAIYIILAPILFIVMRKFFSFQKEMTSLRDQRVKTITELLNGIRVVKLFSLEHI